MPYGTVVLNGQSINCIWPSVLERIPNLWYSICIIFDAQFGSLGMFINNIQSSVAESQQKFVGKTFDLQSPIEFGNCRESALAPFSGKLSEFGIWKRALTSQEIFNFSLKCNSNVVSISSFF